MPQSEINVAPWTEEEVRNLNLWQRAGQFHPFTCGNRDENHRWIDGDLGTLLATEDGWICRDCDYTQNWAHPYMFQEPHPYMFQEPFSPLETPFEFATEEGDWVCSGHVSYEEIAKRVATSVGMDVSELVDDGNVSDVEHRWAIGDDCNLWWGDVHATTTNAIPITLVRW